MTIQTHSYAKGEDFTLIMNFLANLWERTKSYENWFPIRFENNINTREDGVRIWEEIAEETSHSEKKIVGLTTRESSEDYFLHVDPDYRSIEREIVEWIEDHFRRNRSGLGEKSKLKINILEGNIQRESLLVNLGFNKERVYGYYRIYNENTPNRVHNYPKNFKIRQVQRSDFEQLALITRKVFGHGGWFNKDILERISKSSFYHQELDLICLTSDGIIASFCTLRFDSYSKVMILEPMGTNPDYRNLGLGKAIITEVIKRSKKFNPALICIDGAADTPAANRLYDSTGFVEKHAIYSWAKY